MMVGLFFSVYQLCTTYLQATGQASFATLASMLSKGIIYIPVLFLMNAVLGMYGILFTGAVTDMLSLAAVIGLVLLSIRLEKRKEAQPETISN